MNVHGTSVIRRVPIIEPKRVGKPGIGFGQGNQFAGTFVSQMNRTALFVVENTSYTLESEQEIAHARPVGLVGDIDVGNLVIADGEGSAGESVEVFAEGTRPHRQQARFTQGAIGQHRPTNLHMAILANHPYPCPNRTSRIEQWGTSGIQLTEQARHVTGLWTKALGVVIEMRQVYEC